MAWGPVRWLCTEAFDACLETQKYFCVSEKALAWPQVLPFASGSLLA